MTWTTRLSAAARNDFDEIVDWTLDQLGEAQATAHARALTALTGDLDEGPSQPGVKKRPEIGRGMFTLHIARRGPKGRHFVVFRVVGRRTKTLEVLRLLHDAMDLPRHLPPAEDKE
jgi:toxin ParE1/3/4